MKRFYPLLFILLLTACSPRHSLMVDGKLWSSLFQQKAAEYKALCIQAYNIAQLRLDEALKAHHDKLLAIVTDIDETFLDNSPYSVERSEKGLDYDTTTWFQWTALGIADTLPGALQFFNYAASKHVEIFYISNRKEKERQGTLQNLQRYHFPYADDQHLVLRQPGSSSSKEQRRKTVADSHDIVLLLGDNLADFSSLFDGRKTTGERASLVEQRSADFGSRFIVLPNANYGGWEEAIYGGNNGLHLSKKDSAIKSNLRDINAVSGTH